MNQAITLDPFALPDLPPQVEWSISITNADAGAVLAEHDSHRVLKTASIGKVFLLTEVARRIEVGELDPRQPVSRRLGEKVADSGLWYLLQQEDLPLVDLCQLVGAFSDNLATNVLVGLLGVDEITATSARLGYRESALLDVVRTDRGPQHPVALSVGNAAELADFMARLHRGVIVSEAVSQQVRDWLAAGADLSMVASAFALDPLAHNEFDRGVRLVNKTGTVSTARVDIGTVEIGSDESGARACIAYAVGANWAPQVEARNEVLSTMTEIGRRIGACLSV